MASSEFLLSVWDVPSASTFTPFVPSNSLHILPFSGHQFRSFLINTQPSLGLHKRRYVPSFHACRRTQIHSWLFTDVGKRVHIQAQIQHMLVYTQLLIQANTAQTRPSFDMSLCLQMHGQPSTHADTPSDPQSCTCIYMLSSEYALIHAHTCPSLKT